MISFAGIVQRFWPEVKNSYFVEHCLMTNSELVDIDFLVLFLVDAEQIKSHEIQVSNNKGRE